MLARRSGSERRTREATGGNPARREVPIRSDLVVGVVFNLAVWFALHVLFGTLDEQSAYGMRLLVPEFATLDGAALLISLGAFVALLRFEWRVLKTLGSASFVGMVYQVFLVG